MLHVEDLMEQHPILFALCPRISSVDEAWVVKVFNEYLANIHLSITSLFPRALARKIRFFRVSA